MSDILVPVKGRYSIDLKKDNVSNVPISVNGGRSIELIADTNVIPLVSRCAKYKFCHEVEVMACKYITDAEDYFLGIKNGVLVALLPIDAPTKNLSFGVKLDESFGHLEFYARHIDHILGLNLDECICVMKSGAKVDSALLGIKSNPANTIIPIYVLNTSYALGIDGNEFAADIVISPWPVNEAIGIELRDLDSLIHINSLVNNSVFGIKNNDITCLHGYRVAPHTWKMGIYDETASADFSVSSKLDDFLLGIDSSKIKCGFYCDADTGNFKLGVANKESRPILYRFSIIENSGLGIANNSVNGRLFYQAAFYNALNLGVQNGILKPSIDIITQCDKSKLVLDMQLNYSLAVSATNTNGQLGIKISEKNAPLVRKRLLGEMDGLTLSDFDNQTLGELYYIVIG